MPLNWQNIVKFSILPKLMYRINAIPIKIPTLYFTGLENIRIHMNLQRPQTAKASLRSKDSVGSITIYRLKLYYRAIVIRTAW